MSEGATASDSFSLRLPAALESSRLARRRLGELLAAARSSQRLMQDADLIVHELFINGVLHGSGDDATQQLIGVSCRLEPECLVISVHDHGSSGRVEVQPLTDDQPSGRGLALVAALSRSWSVDRSRGTTVSACLGR